MGRVVRGRFVPSPSGRTYLGNVFSVLLAQLSVQWAGGVAVLQMEGLGPDRCRATYAGQLVDGLRWPGLDWSEGYQKDGVRDPYLQSERAARYATTSRALEERRLVYPCYCTRAECLVASAPHRSDGQVVYSGKCRYLTEEERTRLAWIRCPTWHLIVPDQEVSFTDGLQGMYRENLLRDCGNFTLHHSDGVCAYQSVVACDDGDTEVTQVVRGRNLLGSTPRQLYLRGLLGLTSPEFYHAPLLLAPGGRQLFKREHDLDMGVLRERFTSAELTGRLAFWAGQTNRPELVILAEPVGHFEWKNVPRGDIIVEQLQEQKGAGRSVPARSFAVHGARYPDVITHLRQWPSWDSKTR